MPRKPRVWYPGATYHIYARGNNRSAIFQHDKDYKVYLKLLNTVRRNSPFVLHSYCLMTNHLHLQIETIQDHISTIMKDLHTNYAIYFNKRYDRVGHVFQGRFGDTLIKNSSHFLETSRYIHRNPLEAHMVKQLEDYPWSSYPSYIHQLDNPYIDRSKTESYFQNLPQLNYQQFVESDIDIKDAVSQSLLIL